MDLPSIVAFIYRFFASYVYLLDHSIYFAPRLPQKEVDDMILIIVIVTAT